MLLAVNAHSSPSCNHMTLQHETCLLQVDPHLHTYVENLKQQEAASEATSTITEQHQQRPKQQQGAVQTCSLTLHPSASVGSSTAAATPKGDYINAVW